VGHWYSRSGKPCHFIDTPKGSRDATLRDARKLGLVPGFSGVTSVLSKPGLDKWKENQLLEAAWQESDEDDFPAWCGKVKKLASERGNKARDRGLEIHDAIEEYIKTGLHKDFPMEFEPYIVAVQSAIKDELGLSLRALEAETTFSSPLGYGGMIDALKRSHPVLLDWKTKDKEFDEKTKLVFDDHGMQLAAYREGIGLSDAVCANVFISPSANVRVEIWKEEELQRLYEKFLTCLKLWQLDRKYDSSYG
jgi:hypothetical protein